MSTRALKHIAVIMDGNGRWARQRGWPRTRGHIQGANAAKQCVEACLELGIEYLTLYTFSTENWRRPKEEIDTLMGLLQKFLRDYTEDLRKRSVKLEAIGRLNEMPAMYPDPTGTKVTLCPAPAVRSPTIVARSRFCSTKAQSSAADPVLRLVNT